LWSIYDQKRKLANNLPQKNHSLFVEVNLGPDVPPKNLYGNLRHNSSSRGGIDFDVERINELIV
jgi:hypothetical protein